MYANVHVRRAILLYPDGLFNPPRDRHEKKLFVVGIALNARRLPSPYRAYP